MSRPTKEAPTGRRLAILCLGALGVVYGDIGTSPLYALKECFGPHSGIAPSPANVLGILSLVFWSLILVVTIKYLVFVMRADNAGEGGILALLSLIRPNEGERRAREDEDARKTLWWVVKVLAIFGAALLYGDGMITPAISVLSALEGLEIATPAFQPWVLPATLAILVVFFFCQRFGTGRVGAVFGPVTLVWFGVSALLGLLAIARDPGILAAIDPRNGAAFFGRNGAAGFHVLGSVFLVVTGGEALYADMGHFGLKPIRLAWFAYVLPALLLSYFGQGALLLRDPSAVSNPFFRLAPAWSVIPLVALATAATVIASQAVVSGAFSLSAQAVRLGYLPRLDIRHTSAHEAGQIWIPSVNTLLALCTVGLVLGFRTSGNLAAAYGIAVTGTMGVTTLLFFLVARRVWKWSGVVAAGMLVLFLVPDLAFFSANALKIAHGGWFPLAVGAVVFLLMTTWRRGRSILDERLAEKAEPLADLLDRLAEKPPIRIPGTAAFLTRLGAGAPPALLQNLRVNGVLHENVALVTLVTEEEPRVRDERFSLTPLRPGFWRVRVRFGFMEEPDLTAALETAPEDVRDLLSKATWFLGRETLFATHRPGMAIWREKLFGVMARNARGAAWSFGLPKDRIVEIGTPIEL